MVDNFSTVSLSQSSRRKEDLAGFVPFQAELLARPHRPVYRMHRYFARRPHNVMAALVEHFSVVGEVVLDPFMGGGVTLVEGCERGRRVIGFDTSPIAGFVTRTELATVNLDEYRASVTRVTKSSRETIRDLYTTSCRSCTESARVLWFEHSMEPTCIGCGVPFVVARAQKVGLGAWSCPHCSARNRIAPQAGMPEQLVAMLVRCEKCGSAVDDPLQSDIDLDRDLSRDREGLIKKLARYIPTAQIPDNNMQRESALHKKGYKYFHQFFSTRQLISLASLRAAIEEEPAALRDVLLLAFSSTLRFGNRMVTRNPAWRGDRPLEWVGTGFWLPTVYLDANLEDEFKRRANAVVKGKLDFNGPASGGESSAAEVASHVPGAVWAAETRSSTKMPLPDSSIDAIVTDPPYGSYVHYADMSNFWNVWLPRDEQRGTGTLIGTAEEAVVARKRFPGAKDSSDYSRLLADVFAECFRVLRPGRCMVLTFNNREPRAWAALIVAACKAGFHVPTGGVVFQPGVSNYRHTARTRRSGSVHGDFIITFRKLPGADPRSVVRGSEVEDPLTEEACIARIEQVLGAGPLDTEQLMREFYKSVIPDLIEHIWGLDSTAAEELLLRVERLDLFNSERQERLRTRLTFDGGLWRARATSGAGKQGKCNS